MVMTKRPSPTSSRKLPPLSSPSHFAVARMVCSLVHSTTISLTVPLPCICRIREPSNLSVADSSAAAAISSPSTARSGSG